MALRIKETGSGDRNVVLLHGYLESLDVWDDFQRILSKQARVLSVDLPGHGISEVKGDVHTMEFLADTVHAAMLSQGMERAVVVGHSMGGYVALELLRNHPEALAGIVLFHSGPHADSEQKKQDREREISLIQGGKKELIARMFPQVGFAPQNRRRLAAEIEDLSEQIILTEDEGIVAILRGLMRRRDNNDTLHNSGVPQLFILGRHDEYITPEAATVVVGNHPQAQVEWLEESGHMGFVEEPARSMEIILAFLDKVYGAQ